jgi:hypothetical protein
MYEVQKQETVPAPRFRVYQISLLIQECGQVYLNWIQSLWGTAPLTRHRVNFGTGYRDAGNDIHCGYRPEHTAHGTWYAVRNDGIQLDLELSCYSNCSENRGGLEGLLALDIGVR